MYYVRYTFLADQNGQIPRYTSVPVSVAPIVGLEEDDPVIRCG